MCIRFILCILHGTIWKDITRLKTSHKWTHTGVYRKFVLLYQISQLVNYHNYMYDMIGLQTVLKHNNESPLNKRELSSLHVQ